jgi:hypothetical protein
LTGELALDLGPGGPIVSQPGGIRLAGTGGGQLCLVGMDGHDSATEEDMQLLCRWSHRAKVSLVAALHATFLAGNGPFLPHLRPATVCDLAVR